MNRRLTQAFWSTKSGRYKTIPTTNHLEHHSTSFSLPYGFGTTKTPKTSAIPPGLRVDTSRDKAFCIENEISKMQQSIADAKSKKQYLKTRRSLSTSILLWT